MDSDVSSSTVGTWWMPTLAILGHEWRGLWSSWLVRLWLVAAGLLTFLTVTTSWAGQPTAQAISTLLGWYLILPWFLAVIMLGITPVTGSRLDALADGILCRPVTRYEYLLASWAARVSVVLTVFLATTIPAVLVLACATNREAAGDPVTWYGVGAALAVVSLVMVFLVSLAFLAGTVLRRPLLAAIVLIFCWFPINLVLDTISLEEFSPISLTRALPTLLKTSWSNEKEADTQELADADMPAMSPQAAQFIAMLSGTAPVQQKPPDSFFERGDYEDFSLFRVVLGYGVPSLLAVALALLSFVWRDL